MMLGHDKGVGVDEFEDDKLMDDEEEDDEIEEIEGDGLMNEVGGFEGFGDVEGEEQSKNNDDILCEYGSLYFIEWILTF